MPHPTSQTVTVPTLITNGRDIRTLGEAHAQSTGVLEQAGAGNIVRLVRVGNPRSVIEGICADTYTRVTGNHTIYIVTRANERGRAERYMEYLWFEWDVYLLPESFRPSLNLSAQAERQR